MTPACNLNSEGNHERSSHFSLVMAQENVFINFGIIQQAIGIRLEGKVTSGQRLCKKDK